jgi:hypothetical protein
MEPKSPDVLPWRHRQLPNRRPVENAASSGQIGRFNDDESSSFIYEVLIRQLCKITFSAASAFIGNPRIPARGEKGLQIAAAVEGD